MKQHFKLLHLFLIPVLMFGFGYLMIPIYDIFCDITGLNGKTGSLSEVQAEKLEVNEDRFVTIEFISALNRQAKWDFQADTKRMTVHPGKSYVASYTATNQLKQPVTGQAVPSVAPARAANYFNKIECFCFQQQEFQPNETKQMPLVFIVDPDLPDDINTVTLSYTFFDVNSRIN